MAPIKGLSAREYLAVALDEVQGGAWNDRLSIVHRLDATHVGLSRRGARRGTIPATKGRFQCATSDLGCSTWVWPRFSSVFELTEVVLKNTSPRVRIHFFLSIARGILACVAAMAEGLIVQANGTVYDTNQNVTWLADANLAVGPEGQAILKAARIISVAPSGIMDYPTALRFVRAMNTIPCQGKGYLCHNTWQLPVMVTDPAHDPTCAVHRGLDGNSFGPNCQGSAFGILFYRGLGLRYPSSVAPRFQNSVAGFLNLHPALYWSATDGGQTGQQTFSFLTGQSGSNTTDFNLLHVLAMHRGLLTGSSIQRGATAPLRRTESASTSQEGSPPSLVS